MTTLILHLCAPNDSNGNPRRVFVGIDTESGNVVGTLDEGYSGGHMSILRETFAGELVGGPRIDVSAATYRQYANATVISDDELNTAEPAEDTYEGADRHGLAGIGGTGQTRRTA